MHPCTLHEHSTRRRSFALHLSRAPGNAPLHPCTLAPLHHAPLHPCTMHPCTAVRHRPSARASRASARRALAWACVRSSCAWSSATCASRISVLVETPAANRSPTTRRASEAERTASLAAAIDALRRVEIQSPLQHLDLQLAVELGQPFLGGQLGGRLLRDVGCHATAVPERPAEVHAGVPRRLPLIGPREEARVGPREVDARRPRRAQAACRPPPPRGARRLRQCAPRGPAGRASLSAPRPRAAAPAAAAGGAASSCALRVSSASGGAPMSRRRSASACSRRLRAWISSTCCRERCASTDRTSFGGTRPTFSRLRTSSSVASMRRSDSVRTLTDSPAVTTAQ